MIGNTTGPKTYYVWYAESGTLNQVQFAKYTTYTARTYNLNCVVWIEKSDGIARTERGPLVILIH